MRRLLPPVFALLLILAGCGDDAAAPDDSGGAATADTSAAAEPSTASTSESDVTEASPTTADSGAPSVEPTSACDHPYFPARLGASWTYRTFDGAEVPWAITSVDGDTAVMQAELDSQEGITELTINFTCDESGISAPEFGFAGMPFGFDANSLVAEGVTLLPADQLVEGATWTSLIEVEAEMEGGIAVTVKRNTTYTVLGFDDLTVEAGTFPAVLVRSEFTLDIDMAGAAVSTDGALDTWFAEGIGIAKEAEYNPNGGPPAYGLELIGYMIP